MVEKTHLSASEADRMAPPRATRTSDAESPAPSRSSETVADAAASAPHENRVARHDAVSGDHHGAADSVAPNPAPRTASFEAALAAIRNAWDASRRADTQPLAATARETTKPQPERVASPQPVQDEWGLFDPNRCGFAAVVDKLNDAPGEEDDSKEERTTVRVISYC